MMNDPTSVDVGRDTRVRGRREPTEREAAITQITPRSGQVRTANRHSMRPLLLLLLRPPYPYLALNLNLAET
jgi:hypothetical protein